MANRGMEHDDRNRSWGSDWERGREGDWRNREDWRSREDEWRGRERENERWAGERGGAGYGRDVDWRSDWRQGQGPESQEWRRGREGDGRVPMGGEYGMPAGFSGGMGPGYMTSGWIGPGYAGGFGRSSGLGSFNMNTGAGYGTWTGTPYGTYSRGDWAEGPHTGKGPQGYQRSSERIHEEVCEALTRHGQVDASDVNVRVENGEVTLDGHVHSRRQKRMAEEAIESISGVRDVHNHLRVIHHPGNGGLHETSPAHQAGLQPMGSGATEGVTTRESERTRRS